jgi:hypothetical protein
MGATNKGRRLKQTLFNEIVSRFPTEHPKKEEERNEILKKYNKQFTKPNSHII